MPPAVIDNDVEAKLHEKGPATAKQLAQRLEYPLQDVIASLGRLKSAGIVRLDMGEATRRKSSELFWTVKPL